MTPEIEYSDKVMASLRAMLDHWGRYVRHQNSVENIGYASSTKEYGQFIYLGYEEDMDMAVASLLQPMRRVIDREYVDRRKNRHEFYPIGRVQQDKAVSEKFSYSHYKSILRIGTRLLVKPLGSRIIVY